MGQAEARPYDVAILGSGLAGTILAAILARHGRRVVLLEKGSHPRFAIGESLLPQSTMWLWILGERFAVPEIQHLSRLDSIRQHVTPTCGLKRTIGFLYHQEGMRQNPAKGHLLVPPATPLTVESHLFRQEVDLYMLRVARAYGADYRERLDVRDLDLGRDGVRLRTAEGEEIRARYLVDGSGYRSPVADKLGLRDDPTPLRTRSRTIFTHLRHVPLYDDTLAAGESPGLSARWSDGTLHHVFPGGWFWVIPFNNHPEAGNELCSVGLTLDLAVHPASDLPPEREFWQVVERFPSIAAQLRGAEAVRGWTATGRLQYSAHRGAGERFFLLAHAHGFVDALYSRGLISSFEIIHALAGPLLEALADDDFLPARFARAEALQAALLTANDRMVHNSYRAFRHYELWNGWVRIWLLNKIFGDLRLFSRCCEYLGGHDPALLASLDDDPLPGSLAAGGDLVQQLFDRGESLIDRVDAGELSAAAAAAGIFAELGAASWLPPIHAWGDPEVRHLDFLPEKLGRMVAWGHAEAPAPIRDRLFRWDPAVLGPR
ncbi:MAG TPA: FAD-dependent monooxygenase [Thermoanaerobaculia bacterium]|nr:FAD-dependent monooxygenase [Thermoanaerobaculia bacterium]